MEETVSQTQKQWNYGLLKNEACVAPESTRTSLEIGDEEVLIRVQGLSVRLFVRSKEVALAPYLVYASPNIAGTIPVREYEGVIGGSRFRIYCFDADTDIDLIDSHGTVWNGTCRYREEGMS
jgi:hypothetical protein